MRASYKKFLSFFRYLLTVKIFEKRSAKVKNGISMIPVYAMPFSMISLRLLYGVTSVYYGKTTVLLKDKK